MPFYETLREAMRAVAANKMRSFLTSLGVFIGVLSVMVVVSIIQGFFAYFNQQLASLGSTTILVDPSGAEMHREHIARRVTLTADDGVLVTQTSDHIETFCPVVFQGVSIAKGDLNDTTFVVGTTPEFPQVNAFFVATGRFFTAIDEEHRKKVVVIGEEIKNKLRLPDDPLGEEILLNGSSFTVIGVMESRGTAFGQNQDDFLVIPYGTALVMAGREMADRVQLRFRATSEEDLEAAENEIRQVLRRAHHLRVDMPDDFTVFTQKTFAAIINKVNRVATFVLGGIVCITLLVGGIGIFNIMLVSVTERTREIGVRMAVGARRSDILMQFLAEAAFLGLIGGVAGVGLGMLVAKLGDILLGKIATGMEVNTPMWAILLGLGFSVATGVAAGFFPAVAASRKDPIESLRYE